MEGLSTGENILAKAATDTRMCENLRFVLNYSDGG
jgi:hypothetical protein